MQPLTRTIPVVVTLDLKATLRPLHGWFAEDGWWLTARTAQGPASLRIRRKPETLVGEAWGEGGSWLLHRLDSIAGLDDDPDSFQTDHPIVGELHRRHPGRRFGRTGLVFDALVRAVSGQKVTGQEAAAAMRGLRRRFGDPAPGPRPGLRLPPDPQRMAEAPYWVYHELHLEKRRADLLRNVSTSAGMIDQLAAMTSPDAARTLSTIPGIGPWTVAKTLAVSHGDPDQVEVGDFHLKHIVVHHLTGRPRGTDEEMLELLEPFRPNRGRVTRLLHTLGHEPSFGPRVTPKDITRI
ncbi:MAG: DNA-3-methyladenine glycosylase family protein [Acidimicrobiia bacterium]